MNEAVSDEALFSQLAKEWHALVVAEARATADAWQRRLEELSAEQHRLVTAGQWLDGYADLLWVIGKARWETYHSAVLRWFLTPSGRHQLGSKFLERLMRHCFPTVETGELSTLRASCEVERDDTRADIVVWASNFTLVIENKVDAGEQPFQCERLHRHFSSDADPNPLFVFLTPHGHAPETANDVFRLLSYRDVRALLEDCHSDNPSVLNYLETLRREFP